MGCFFPEMGLGGMSTIQLKNVKSFAAGSVKRTIMNIGSHNIAMGQLDSTSATLSPIRPPCKNHCMIFTILSDSHAKGMKKELVVIF